MKVSKTFRMDPALAGRLERHARREQVSLTSVVEDGLDRLLSAAEEGGTVVSGDPARDASASPPPSSTVSNGEIDLPGWISGKSGLPRAICQRYVEAGRVSVGGVEFHGETVPVEALPVVRLDGTLVAARG